MYFFLLGLSAFGLFVGIWIMRSSEESSDFEIAPILELEEEAREEDELEEEDDTEDHI